MADKTDIQYEAPTWYEIYGQLLCQSQKIQDDRYKPDTIVGICRGGIIPARIICDLLGTKEFTTIQIEYYKGTNQTNKKPILKQCLNLHLKDKTVLLIDDISDSGNSLQFAKEHLIQNGVKEIRIATLFTKPASITKPDYYEKETNNWIVFPWDVKETIREIIRKQQGKRGGAKEIAKLVKGGVSKQLVEEFLKDMQ